MPEKYKMERDYYQKKSVELCEDLLHTRMSIEGLIEEKEKLIDDNTRLVHFNEEKLVEAKRKIKRLEQEILYSKGVCCSPKLVQASFKALEESDAGQSSVISDTVCVGSMYGGKVYSYVIHVHNK